MRRVQNGLDVLGEAAPAPLRAAHIRRAAERRSARTWGYRVSSARGAERSVSACALSLSLPPSLPPSYVDACVCVRVCLRALMSRVGVLRGCERP